MEDIINFLFVLKKNVTLPCRRQEGFLWNAFYLNKKKSVLLWINQPNSCTLVWSEKWMYLETCAILLWKPRVLWCSEHHGVTGHMEPEALLGLCLLLCAGFSELASDSHHPQEHWGTTEPTSLHVIPGFQAEMSCSKRVFLGKTDAHKWCISPEYLDIVGTTSLCLWISSL